jgi:hypothetical protein
MHRSGTSLVAELIHRWGAFGRSEDCLPSDKWNAHGYWELSALVDLNTRILDELGASWSFPPPEKLDSRLELLAQRSDFRGEAYNLLSRMESRSPGFWFWKDPRLSLLLPFWQEIWGDKVRYVICVRNPVEICQSLQERDRLSFPVSIALWQRYMLSVLQWTRGLPAYVVSYNAMLRNSARECAGLAQFLGGCSESGRVTEMQRAVETDLRHFIAGRPAAHRLTRTQSELYEALESVAAGVSPLSAMDLRKYALAGTWRSSLYVSLLVQKLLLRNRARPSLTVQVR